MSHLFLTGFMGAGKSTVGRAVAARLGRPFLDLDREIERREGASVQDLFRERGEEGFREAEHAALAALADAPDAVVATGGGVVLRDDNRVLLRRLGQVVYLAVTPEEAMARLGDGRDRPLLAGRGLAAASEILGARLSLYRATADHVVDTSGRDPESVAEEVVGWVRSTDSGSASDGPVTVRVESGDRAPAYDVVIGHGLLGQAGERIFAVLGPRRLAVVTDSTVGPLYAARLEESLWAAGYEVACTVVPAGERSKSWQAAGDLLEWLAVAALDRTSAIVALGGGVVGDLAGFCAATYLRGIDLVQVPTTLLAQVDSAIGGKTAVDLAAGKNLAGAFWPPRLVLADTACLATLPDAEWTNGLVEAAKAALLAGEDATVRMERTTPALVERDAAETERMVCEAAAFKAHVVSRDVREAGLRECLNLGHTLGHAIERALGYGAVSHGVAVAEGIRFAATLAEELAVAPPALTARIVALLDGLQVPRLSAWPNSEALLEAMRVDKKARAGAIRFVLLEAPGVWRVVPVDDDVIAAAIARFVGAHPATEG